MAGHAAQIKIPAVYYRGGTSKGIFSNAAICLRPHNTPAQHAIKSCSAFSAAPIPTANR
ncbi:acnD-accessory PrpF domain protein [Neisseria musculi]|uniref:AcnD-accessory PrpF domain protein n=1 Tax=Neisseria musculi TaxID=1815583 RepID=A0A7H1MA74_9NEIS|nr:hypothetical protein H7A79_2710 [Neisseria musculi]